jgi:hypothetical protein
MINFLVTMHAMSKKKIIKKRINKRPLYFNIIKYYDITRREMWQTFFKPSNVLFIVAITYSSLIELFLKILHHILVQLECLDENIRIDRNIRSKHIVCYSDEPRILAAEKGKINSIGISYIKLEVKETNWEGKDISCI